ncbi:Plastidic glucose transporter 4 [Glycine soja]|uniref:Plastidic glucose transporter 4 n=1 Tax=Glycine soja TaxID=3848 RepID=A0A445FE55_GLYSO|nr:Plastidic glucose transporter 4 [Glycine soja]
MLALVMHDLTVASEGSSEPEAGWFDLFSSRYRKVVSVGATLFLLQQLVGINTTVYYSTSVFRSAGIASDAAASALVGASNVFGTIVASSLMDKKGRKRLLITSFSGMLHCGGRKIEHCGAVGRRDVRDRDWRDRETRGYWERDIKGLPHIDQFLNSPHIDHWNVVVRILRFIKGSPWEDYCMRTGDIKILFLILMQTGLDLLRIGGTPQHIVFSLGGTSFHGKARNKICRRKY